MHALVLVLLEDDENTKQVADSLKLSGHHVLPSDNFSHAISLLQGEHIDLIISDVHLENGGSVFDFLKWVRKNPSTADTPFVLLSFRPTPTAKYLEDALKTTARLLGAAMYIVMDTFSSDEFRTLIDSLLPAKEESLELSMKSNEQ